MSRGEVKSRGLIRIVPPPLELKQTCAKCKYILRDGYCTQHGWYVKNPSATARCRILNIKRRGLY